MTVVIRHLDHIDYTHTAKPATTSGIINKPNETTSSTDQRQSAPLSWQIRECHQ